MKIKKVLFTLFAVVGLMTVSFLGVSASESDQSKVKFFDKSEYNIKDISDCEQVDIKFGEKKFENDGLNLFALYVKLRSLLSHGLYYGNDVLAKLFGEYLNECFYKKEVVCEGSGLCYIPSGYEKDKSFIKRVKYKLFDDDCLNVSSKDFEKYKKEFEELLGYLKKFYEKFKYLFSEASKNLNKLKSKKQVESKIEGIYKDALEEAIKYLNKSKEDVEKKREYLEGDFVKIYGAFVKRNVEELKFELKHIKGFVRGLEKKEVRDEIASAFMKSITMLGNFKGALNKNKFWNNKRKTYGRILDVADGITFEEVEKVKKEKEKKVKKKSVAKKEKSQKNKKNKKDKKIKKVRKSKS